jgi:hypothetical protein
MEISLAKRKTLKSRRKQNLPETLSFLREGKKS